MNYEQKYKEALEKARQFSEHPLQEDSSSIVEYIFPELADSEDERIRKALIRFHKSTIDVDGIKGEDIIAWLEKQGEQKTADKVEPKFKVGDWISGYYTNYKVTAINSKGYVVEDTDGNKINILFENEKFHHLFTIADAKNGDVLVVPHIEGSEHSEQIFIFKEIKDREYAKNAVEYYCRYLDGEFRTNERGFMGQADDYFTPATKEQRDLLFQKIKEAGYEWDAEKKKLKKIVAWLEKQGEKTINQPDFEIPFGAKDSELIEESYYIPKGYHAEISKDKVTIKKGEQKPVWSEEDERNLKGIIDEIEANKNTAPDYDLATYDRFLSWLKSIKERVQPQNTWKPSDAQMASITCAVRKMKESACYDSELVSLYQDLKKLKG